MRSEERHNAVERALRFPMLVLALVFAAILIYELRVELTSDQRLISEIAQAVIWAAFICEFVGLWTLAPNRRVFLRAHWFDALTLLLPMLRFFRVLWALRLFALAGRASDDLRGQFGQRGRAILSALVVAYALFWVLTYDRLPREIRIAAGHEGSLYRKVGSKLADGLRTQTGRKVRTMDTSGSLENRALAQDGGTELAILQASTVSSGTLVTMAPLYEEVVHLIVRQGTGIRRVEDLAGRRLAVGEEDSGTYHTAQAILSQYRLDDGSVEEVPVGPSALSSDPALDAAFEVTGLLNPSLHELLSSGRFSLVPIDDGPAFAVAHPSFRAAVIPKGLYSERPPIPPAPVETVGTTAILVARKGASASLVNAGLRALYEGDVARAVPVLIPAHEASEWTGASLDPMARRYHDPYGGVGTVANLVQSIAAVKELLLALGAGVYLLYKRRGEVRTRAEREELTVQKENLDALLEATMAIERLQIGLDDPDMLAEYLGQVTRVKLKALSDLTHEALRGDRQFSIFLMQCDNLSRKLESKLARLDAHRSEG